MQAKDIADAVMLDLVRECCDAECSYWPEASWHGGRPGYAEAGDRAQPRGHWANLSDLTKKLALPQKLVAAKLSKLIRRGLLTGCTCGCRGDFEITESGRAYLRG